MQIFWFIWVLGQKLRNLFEKVQVFHRKSQVRAELTSRTFQNVNIIRSLSMKNRKSRLNWTPQEDDVIKSLHEEDQLSSWKKIAKELTKRSLKWKRTPKQCRQRYMNCLKFGNQCQETNEWTRAEEEKLFENVLIYGQRWVRIAQFIPGKSENCIKNKFYGSLRKIIRKMNKIDKEEGPKLRKPIKYESILKFLEISNVEKEKEYSQKFGEKLKNFRETQVELFKLTVTQEENNPERYINLSQKLHQFNSVTRYIVCNRRKTKPASRQALLSDSQQDGQQNIVVKKNIENTKGTLSSQEQQSQPFSQLMLGNQYQIGREPQSMGLINLLGANEIEEMAEDFLGGYRDPFQLFF